MYEILHVQNLYNFVHLVNVCMIFTDSYVQGVQVGEMYSFVQVSKFAIAAKMCTFIVT